MKLFNVICFIFIVKHSTFAQVEIIKGRLLAFENVLPIYNAQITLENTDFSIKSNQEGFFKLMGNLPLGEQILKIVHNNYQSIRIPVMIDDNAILDLGEFILKLNIKKQQTLFATIDLSIEDLENTENDSQNQSILQAVRDPFLNSVAFNWSSAFFKVRGLGSEYSKIMLNGVEVNKQFNHRPNWSNWSGLNDQLRTQENTPYTHLNLQSFGGLIGTNQFFFNANAYRKGTKISISSTNRSYQGRMLLSTNSGKLSNGWAYSFSASATRAKQGYIEGTSLRNYSFFASVQKEITKRHSINVTTLYTPVERGKVSANTNEVIALKGRKYNSHWGNQEGEIRNSRIKKIKEPIITLNHYWTASERLKIQNNIFFQTGKISNSRIAYNGKELSKGIGNDPNELFSGTSFNPDPTYYQRLPSFFLEEGKERYEDAFKATQFLKNNGQLNWQELYNRNRNLTTSAYILYDDVVEDNLWVINTLLNYKLSQNTSIQGKIAYKNLISTNYAQITDLLGGKAYLDVDGFSEGDKAQNNLQTPNNIVGKDATFNYHYQLKANTFNGFIQANTSISNWNLYAAVNTKKINYQRNGLFENGNYPGIASLGKSTAIELLGYGAKLGAEYKINNKSNIFTSLLVAESPPSISQSFSNPRQNNSTVIDLQNEQQIAADIQFKYQFDKLKFRISAYTIARKNQTNISFFFTDNIAGLGRVDNAGFLQEITTGINTQNRGFELGLEYKLTSTLTLNTSIAYGEHTYANNPNLYLTSNSFTGPLVLGTTALKNYHLSTGPQQAVGIGFNYQDPNYWWFSTQLNYFSNTYVGVGAFTRSDSFATDIDGQPLLDYNETRAKELLAQEKLPSYFLWNAIGGKSWKLKNNYLGCIIGVQNLLNKIYKTGGYEQTRRSNFSNLNADKSRQFPLFGNKYWQGYGTTFYINTYWHF